MHKGLAISTLESHLKNVKQENENGKISRKYGVLERILIIVALISILAQIIDGAFPQFRMALHGGAFYPEYVKFKILLLFSAFGLVAVRGLTLPPRYLFASWLAFLGYLFVASLVHLYSHGKLLIISWIEYVDNYSLLLFLPILFTLLRSFSENRLAKILAWVFIPIAVLGLAQFVTSLPLVRVVSTDGAFAINSWTIHGQIRSFSLFTSGLRYGYFCAFVLALALSQRSRYQTGRLRSFWTAMVFLALLSVATTVTRNAYLFCAAVLLCHISLPWLRKQGADKVLSLLPLLFFAFLFVVVAAPAILGVFSTKALVLDTSSLAVRLDEWTFFGSRWLQSDVASAFFGTGLSQMSRFSAPGSEMVIDNVLLGVGLHIGLFGLFSFVIVVWSMWFWLVQRYLTSKGDAFAWGVSVWAPFLGIGVLNSAQTFFLPLFFLLVMVSED